MSSLTFEKMHIPGSHLGPDSAYPILYKQKMFEKTSILDESEGLYINYGNILHMLPYTSQDDYDRSETEQVFDVAVLENRFLKATFVPALGGRMWSLYDKVNQRDLIINNPVFRPCNFAGTPGSPAAWSGTAASADIPPSPVPPFSPPPMSSTTAPRCCGFTPLNASGPIPSKWTSS